MAKKNDFYDAEMERMMGENDSTIAYTGKQEEEEAHRESGVQAENPGFYDPDMERLMGGGTASGPRREEQEEQKTPPRKNFNYGKRSARKTSVHPGGYGAASDGWKPAIHGENQVDAFGGWFFRDRDRVGNPVIRLVVENMPQSEATRADEWYGKLGRMPHAGFLHRAGSSPVQVGAYTVFDFEINAQMRSLSELHRQNKLNPAISELILQRLNELIMEYRMELLKNGEQYRALNCLTMDTVFLDRDNKVTVLPVFYTGRNYPVEIAREAMIPGEKTDERSDLYAAAYVAVEVYSDSNGDKPLKKPESEVILACLQAVRLWRPTPNEVKEWLTGKRPKKPVKNVGGEPKDKPFRKPPAKKWIKNLIAWVQSWKGLEEEEDPSDLDDTNYPSAGAGSSGKDDQDDDDSWYDYEEK